jgi:hypothetical protein
MTDLVARSIVPETESPAGHGVSFGEAFQVWLRVAALSFGGPRCWTPQLGGLLPLLIDRRRSGIHLLRRSDARLSSDRIRPKPLFGNRLRVVR